MYALKKAVMDWITTSAFQKYEGTEISSQLFGQ